MSGTKTLRQKIEEDPLLIEVNGIIDYRRNAAKSPAPLKVAPDDRMFKILLYCIDELQREGYNLQKFERRGLTRVLYKHLIPNMYKSKGAYQVMAVRLLLLAIRGLR